MDKLPGEQAGINSIEQQSKVSFSMHRHDLEQAIEDRRYFIQRRDQLMERLHFGVLALNGASLIALLGLASGEGKAAESLGFSGGVILFSACMFALGIMLAAHALNERENLYVGEAADANSRSSTIVRLIAHGQAPMTKDNHESYGAVMTELHDLPQTGFQYSDGTIYPRHWAGGIWLVGISAPLILAVGQRVLALLGVCGG